MNPLGIQNGTDDDLKSSSRLMIVKSKLSKQNPYENFFEL